MFPKRSRAHQYDISGSEGVSAAALLVDGLLIVLLGAVTGTAYQILAIGNYGHPDIYASTGLLVAVFFCGATRLMGATNPIRVSRDSGRARMAIVAWLSTFLFLAVIAFSLRIGTTFSRGAVFCFFALGLPMVTLSRMLVPRFLASTLYANAHRGSEVVIVAPHGNPGFAQTAFDLRSQGTSGIHSIEFDGECANKDWPVERAKLLRRVIDTARIAGPGDIYILSDGTAHDRVTSIVTGLRLLPRAVCVVPPDMIAGMLHRPLRRVGPLFAIEVQKAPLSSVARATKRAIDIAVSAGALLFTLPAFGLIALAIKLDSKGPVFFFQNRNGYRGRTFRIVKFRSMSVQEDGAAVVQARRGDQRVTRVGRWLRKTSLDELPQLINILRGEMSLVGPRPHAVAHDEIYSRQIENYELRQHVKPGMTGWAQVHGLRGETPTVDLMFRRIEFDLWYAANCSVALDLQILIRTAFVLFGQESAY